MAYTIGIDLGGTNIVAGIVRKEPVQLLSCAKRKTNAKERTWQEIADQMLLCCEEALELEGLSWADIDSVGIASPGMVDIRQGIISFASNLPFLDTPMVDYFTQRIHKPVYLANDADAAALGEFVAGAGQGAQSMVAVTLGTGVGSGIILDGKIYTGCGFAAGEFGHTVIRAGGRPCPCGRVGCFEAYASATGLIRTTKEHMEQNPQTLMWQLCDGQLENVSGRTAFQALRQGDAEGKAVVDEYVLALSEGVCNIVNSLQPELICLGGGISKEGELLTGPINDFLEKYAFQRFAKVKTQVVCATLGNDAGVIGAALLEQGI